MKKEKPGIIKKELMDKVPGISKASKDNPFEVPEDYFAGLPEAVEQLKNSRIKKSHRTVLGYSAQRIMAYAGALAILIFLGISVLFLTHKDGINDFAGIDNEHFESYFSYLAAYDEAHYYDILISEEGEYLESVDASLQMALWGEVTEDDPYMEYLLEYMYLYQYLPDDMADID